MQFIDKPEKENWTSIMERPSHDNSLVMESCRNILSEVKNSGDAAIRSFTKKFDGIELDQLEISPTDIASAHADIPGSLKSAITSAKNNIERFHSGQQIAEAIVETMPGVHCWRKNVGIDKVGLYIPGGTAPLFSTVLMLGIPAHLAGCKEIILCSPAGANSKIHPAILYAADLVGISRIFAAGGAQAIAAMAYGTETIPAVNKIFGPGNQYVTAAKQLVQMDGVAIDMPAGPSELLVLADETADPSFVAADLLSQAEHGYDSQVLFVSLSRDMIIAVDNELNRQLATLPRKEVAMKALQNSRSVFFNDAERAMEFINDYAPEHLVIACKNARQLADQVRNAGSVFIGNYAPESAGDYASGTNHTLPTNGFAKAYSGVSLDSFVKKITFQEISRQGLEDISSTIITMAEAEGLMGHANAVKLRTSKN
ncbi:MAG: histidinol dehydrogenase [Flavisolibacter sp.]|nr:histidinol dehydrogenase [Flavisolibacter sp.]